MPVSHNLLGLQAGSPGSEQPGACAPCEAEQLTILLLGRLVPESGTDQLCRIRNIAPGELMLETSDTLRPGQDVHVELRNLFTLRGTVAWSRPPRAGVTLEDRTSVPDLLRSISVRPEGSYAPRAPRLSAACTVEVRCEGRSAAARLLDLSQRGARLRAEGRVVDEQITIRIPGLDPRRAVVRWVHDDEFGVAFLETLAFRQFEHWLQDHRVRYADRLA